MWKLVKYGGPLLLLLGMLLCVVDNAHAALSLNALYAWDYSTHRYESNSARIIFDGNWESFVHQFSTDSAVWPDDIWGTPLPSGYEVYYPCYGTNTNGTAWAGYGGISLFHLDNDPAGAAGFQQTRNWKLVDCDRTGDDLFNDDDLHLWPPDSGWTTWAPCSLRRINQDTENAGGCGADCATQIHTEFVANCDLNCNGTLDTALPPAGLCIYWEAQTPLSADPFWAGTLRGSISDANGDNRVINFGIDRQTAVSLESFTAHSAAGPFVAGLLGLGIGGLALLAWRSKRQK
jgi:hypothetical protein